MKEKMLSIFLIIFGLLFLFYPTLYGITNLKVIAIFLIIFFICFFICKKIKFKIKIKEKYYLWIIIILASITRIGIVFFLEPYITQVSDFSQALNVSHTLDFISDTIQFGGDYYKVFTHWILYPTIINFIYKIFGESQLIALLFNAIILIVSSVFIYINTNMLFNKKNYGLIAAILYIFWPANILYTLIFTQEHICVLILLVVLYLFLKSEDDKTNINYKKIIIFICIGILLALSTFFKNFAPVYIIAFIIYFILKGFKEKNLKKYSLYKILTIAIIILSFVISKAMVYCFIDNLLNTKVARNITPCYLNVGLRENGTYSKTNYEMYFNKLKDNDYDYDKTNSEILKQLFKDNEANLSISLFDKKAEIVFGGDSARLDWVSKSLKNNDNNNLESVVKNKITKINNAYFNILVFCVAIGLISMIKERNLKTFLVYLIFFGCMLILLLVEAQNRYMYAVQPILCILAVLGVIDIKNYYKKSDNK